MRRIIRSLAAILAVFLAFFLFSNLDSSGPLPDANGSPTERGDDLQRLFATWREDQAGKPLVLGLGWSKGVSTTRVDANGVLRVDRATGTLSVEVQGDTSMLGTVWLVKNVPGPRRSVLPESGDTFMKVGRLSQHDGTARLLSQMPDRLDFDVAVITGPHRSPAEERLLVGIPTLFQRMEHWTWRTERALRQGDLLPRLLARFGSSRVLAADFHNPGDLISKGEDLFFNETFAGNGRTCGTCHPAENNFTIDPKFIATLPPDDPLFVAETNPALAENFENPTLMRALGLILENADGFDDPVNKFTMRGVPHTLGLGLSLKPAADGADGTTTPPDQRTGWSGDGAPGGGTLRDFAIGAVVQHFPRTMSRVEGSDFRLPTDEELDALEAFQLSLGRQEELSLDTLQLTDPRARRGQEIFLTADSQGGRLAAGKCNQCHADAGASVGFVPGGFNFNFDSGVERLPDHPADLIDPGKRPPDGGFGTFPNPTQPGAFGNGTFNTPALVETADTPPFFHNNVVRTLEEAVNFYNSESFNNSPAGQLLAGADSGAIGIRLEPTQVEAVASFLRVINVLENIRAATDLLTRALQSSDPRAFTRAALSSHEIQDAIQVLRKGGLHRDAIPHLGKAQKYVRLKRLCFPGVPCIFFALANQELKKAQDLMVE